MKRAFIFAVAACVIAASLCIPAATASDNQPSTIAAAEQQAFELGFALQTPATRTEVFLQAVKKLKATATDEENSGAIAQLAKQSQQLRGVEARSYGHASVLLNTMGAPPGIQSWAAACAKKFGSTIVLSKDAQKTAKSDPNAAAILGAIDESQQVKGENDAHMASITEWLKLSQGGDAVWSMALGALAAGMRSAIVAGRSLALSRTDILSLRDSAPVGTPMPVLDALSNLTPKAGNLAGLIHAPDAKIAPKELKAPETSILDTYAAQKFADAIDREP